MAEWKRDETERALGRQPHVCRICGAEGDFESYLAREMMQAKRDEFVYFVCDHCGCLQIDRVPENLGEYYGSDYYSFQASAASDMVFDTPVKEMRKVLDVGCGGGEWLLYMAREGWGNLYGCDPFLDSDRDYGDRVHIRSCSIHEMEGEGTFDTIRMSDSFEHMTDPLEALKSARRLLKEDGVLRMTIPTYPNIAFEKYGPHWYQLDAPRHIFLHSKESLKYLAEKSGLLISSMKYNSNNNQFARSYCYQHDIPFYEQDGLISMYFGREALEELDREAEICNAREYGDHMDVILKKNALADKTGGKKVVFQRFRRAESRFSYPYPPVYREPDTDYICFTQDEGIASGHWQVRKVEDLSQEALEPYLEGYVLRFELKQNQIQMYSLSEGGKWGNRESLAEVTAMEALPRMKLDLSRFEPTADKNGKYIWQKNPVYKDGQYEGYPLLLTIGVPVSNQIGTIDRCLSHIKPLLDNLDAELVVIDTGSTDGTIEVCKRYGARIFEHPWHDNMSAVRNEAVRHARGLWYMSIDDDEWFEDVEDILLFFQSGIYQKCEAATYIQRNYLDSKGERFSDFRTTRMSKMMPDLHFEGRIHDALLVRTQKPACHLMSYAHHYGFVSDDQAKVEAKFTRNTAILLQDVYEYPGDLRYLFQLANEYRGVGELQAGLSLFVECLSLAVERGPVETHVQRNCSVMLLCCLHDLHDERLFNWAEHLEKTFPMLQVEKAFCAWFCCDLAAAKERPAKQVLDYSDRYEQRRQEYLDDPDPSKTQTFYGLATVEHDSYIMGVASIGFCYSLRMGEVEKALALLERISLEEIGERRGNLLEAAYEAEDRVYDAVCAKITAVQWEEWSDAALNGLAGALAHSGLNLRMERRLPEILSRVSVASIFSWLEIADLAGNATVRARLRAYAILCVEGGRIYGEISLQERAICSRVLKSAYVEGRKGREAGRLLRAYLMATGAFLEQYYSPALLADPDNTAIAPEDRAVCRMAAALADGTPSSENVAMLKQALVIFPPFHQEIRGILKELAESGR